jgi:hypothetical protein
MLLGRDLGIAVALLTTLCALPAQAALPPYWQSASEISTIVNDPRVHDAFTREEPIQSIILTAPDVYEVKTKSCTVIVNVVDKPPEPGQEMMVGPRQFEIEVGEATCQ